MKPVPSVIVVRRFTQVIAYRLIVLRKKRVFKEYIAWRTISKIAKQHGGA